jgi:hypothetical protein
MVFADFWNEMLGNACIMFVVILFGIGWVCKRIGEATKNALKNEDVREAAKFGFWAWIFSTFDD